MTVRDTLIWLHWVVATWRILKGLVPVEVCSGVVPKELQRALANTSLDPILSLFFPQLHQQLLQYVIAFKVSKMYKPQPCYR